LLIVDHAVATRSSTTDALTADAQLAAMPLIRVGLIDEFG
jgi:hypothetical protein